MRVSLGLLAHSEEHLSVEQKATGSKPVQTAMRIINMIKNLWAKIKSLFSRKKDGKVFIDVVDINDPNLMDIIDRLNKSFNDLPLGFQQIFGSPDYGF